MTRPVSILSDIALRTWLDKAAPGDSVEYHSGFLAIDRSSTGRDGLSRIATVALQAAEAGTADLVQRRLGFGIFSYLIVARPKESAAQLALSNVKLKVRSHAA